MGRESFTITRNFFDDICVVGNRVTDGSKFMVRTGQKTYPVITYEPTRAITITIKPRLCTVNWIYDGEQMYVVPKDILPFKNMKYYVCFTKPAPLRHISSGKFVAVISGFFLEEIHWAAE